MKKKVVIAMAIVMLTLAAGCANNTNSQQQPIAEAEETPITDSTAEEAADSETASTAEVLPTETETETKNQSTYQVEMVNYQKDELRDINYPQISGWNNEEKQTEWNDMFRQMAEAAAAELGEKDSVDIFFDIEEQTDEILSLTSSEYYDYNGAAHPSAAMMSYNINMQTGEKMTFADMADPKTVAEVLFRADGTGYTVVDSEITMKEILEYNFIWMEPTEESLENSLAHFDGELEDYGEDETMGYSFMRDGKVCLIFYVNHAMGDYVVVEVE